MVEAILIIFTSLWGNLHIIQGIPCEMLQHFGEGLYVTLYMVFSPWYIKSCISCKIWINFSFEFHRLQVLYCLVHCSANIFYMYHKSYHLLFLGILYHWPMKVFIKTYCSIQEQLCFSFHQVFTLILFLYSGLLRNWAV